MHAPSQVSSTCSPHHYPAKSAAPPGSSYRPAKSQAAARHYHPAPMVGRRATSRTELLEDVIASFFSSSSVPGGGIVESPDNAGACVSSGGHSLATMKRCPMTPISEKNYLGTNISGWYRVGRNYSNGQYLGRGNGKGKREKHQQTEKRQYSLSEEQVSYQYILRNTIR